MQSAICIHARAPTARPLPQYDEKGNKLDRESIMQALLHF